MRAKTKFVHYEEDKAIIENNPKVFDELYKKFFEAWDSSCKCITCPRCVQMQKYGRLINKNLDMFRNKLKVGGLKPQK